MIDLRRALYGGVVFWSAVLLLLLQPIITKAILPWFGGSAGVWTTSMLFFQGVLLLGYVYAHLLNRTFKLKQQVIVHIALLVVSILLLPLQPNAAWKPAGNEDPALYILGLLATSVGAPYFLLSSTSPLLQSWFSRTFHTELPYRLFAVSNLGSLVALVSYPVLIEPLMPVRMQLFTWSSGFVLFAALCAGAAVLSWRTATISAPGERTSTFDKLTWASLAICPSVLWLAVANQLSQDVAPVPFLWIVPLAIYLLSFVLCFDSSRWYRPRVFRWILPAAWVGITAVVSQRGFINIKYAVLILNASLFVCCMFCHGELARLRPASSKLTSYYVTIAAGGAMGGIFVGLIAPRVFTDYLELPLGMIACIVLALWLLYRLSSRRVMRVALVTLAAVVAGVAFRNPEVKNEIDIRNFYGTLRVGEFGAADRVFRALYNGTIQHGVQYMSPEHRRIPTTYYSPASGASMALHSLMKRGPVYVGVIGLGVGTMAAYARPGDRYRFYELNPDVVRIANSQFLYLRESKGEVSVVSGDARLSLEREPSQQFDLLVVDAFSGDSIPVHLLTKEAFQLYFRHIKPSGALAVHTTNKHLQLPPVVQSVASALEAKSILIHNDEREDFNIHYSSWVIVTKDGPLERELGWLGSRITKNPRLRLWTDDYSNLFFILQ